MERCATRIADNLTSFVRRYWRTGWTALAHWSKSRYCTVEEEKRFDESQEIAKV